MYRRASRLVSRLAIAALVLAGCSTPVVAPDPAPSQLSDDPAPAVEPEPEQPDRGRIVAVDDGELSEGNRLEERAEAFRATVARKFDSLGQELNGCYLPELKRDPNLAGYVVIEMTVGPGGAIVDGPAIRETTLRNPKVEKCVVNLVAAQSYPEPFNGEFTDVSRVFQFGAF